MIITETDRINKIHNAFINFSLRAEKATAATLTETFVDSAPLLQILSNANNSITYGRRGTGKTHALRYLESNVKSANEEAIYLDLRSIGSNTSIYNDQDKPLSERASQLINDVLQEILNALYPIAVECIDHIMHKEELTLRLDDFHSAISSVKINGSIEKQQENEQTETEATQNQISGKLSFKPFASGKTSKNFGLKNSFSGKTINSGTEVLHIDFGSVQTSLSGLIDILGIKRLWLLFDEWSEVPFDLQPYLADLIRRMLLPVNSCIVKIAAIEHRSNFIINQNNGSYIGLELGADITANINLDDFLVFDSDSDKSVQFFKNLLFKHYTSSEQVDNSIKTADELIQLAFTQQNVFSEFVRAVEGVPRDALNLAVTIATKAYGKKISMQDVRNAARDWYHRDKSAVIKNNENLSATLTTIVDEVIKGRKSRAFLFTANSRNDHIEALFDARLLHILKKNISSHDEPGSRYDVFKIDYGCYVDLINTNNEPLGLYEADDAYTQVPKDDYRSIRRAILKPEQLNGGR